MTNLARTAPSDWPAFAQYGLGLVVCFMTGMLAWSVVAESRRKSLTAYEQQEMALKATYRQQAMQVAGLGSWRDQHAAMTARASALRDRLPGDADSERLLETLHRLGQAHRVQLESIRPGKPETKNHLIVVPFEIHAAGRYHGIAGFLSELAGLPRVVAFSALHISALPQHEAVNHLPPELRLTLTAHAYGDPSSLPTAVAEVPR
ncbi:type 4a pilus biogenesis protein PilO [Pandoraea sp.]|uniref:type 4a pilus biogenesis protein PilO n=1 Tax=Pandoraea sp. TaxID=1883445 RepID=UPI0025EA2C6B|nr:type 4a pilus biogenesis protein PilO [Pandoraea sp.]